MSVDRCSLRLTIGIYHLIDTDYFLKNNRLSDPNNCPDSILELYVGMCVGKKFVE